MIVSNLVALTREYNIKVFTNTGHAVQIIVPSTKYPSTGIRLISLYIYKTAALDRVCVSVRVINAGVGKVCRKNFITHEFKQKIHIAL